jgi:hypothetical protein
MNTDELPAILFMCDLQARCIRLSASTKFLPLLELRGSAGILAQLRSFTSDLRKHKEGKLKASTLVQRGSKFLAQFPDLQLRFWRFMSDPRACVPDSLVPVATTGKFKPLDSHLVLQHIVHILPYPTAARLAQCCKWLRQIIDTRLLVDLRQRFEHRMKLTGGGAPLRLVTTDDKPLALHVLREDRLIGLEYEGVHYTLSPHDVCDSDQRFRIIGSWSRTFSRTKLYQLLDQIAKVPATQPLDLCMWATLTPLDATSLCIEITAHGEFGLISRKDKGVTHWPAIRAVRVDRVVWDSMVKCPSIKDTPRGAPDATEGRASADDSDRD